MLLHILTTQTVAFKSLLAFDPTIVIPWYRYSHWTRRTIIVSYNTVVASRPSTVGKPDEFVAAAASGSISKGWSNDCEGFRAGRRQFTRVHNFLRNASRVIHYCLYIAKVFLHMCDRPNRPNLRMASLGLFLLSSPDP